MLFTSNGSLGYLTLYVILINFNICELTRTNYSDPDGTKDKKGYEILSRKKRFLIFPEGSSLQLVFCVTYPMIFTIGDIFLYGYTAALAWELPQDPYSPFDHKADPLHRRTDSKNIFFIDDDGKVLFKRPYKRIPIVNPAFAKRSVGAADSPAGANGDDEKKSHANGEFKIDRKRMHAEQIQRIYLQAERRASADFHRSSRADLYSKIENFFTAAGAGGRPCTLRMLCEARKMQNKSQGNFVQEILLAVFTLPKGPEFHRDSEKEYDTAHSTAESCDALYPCTQFTTIDSPATVI